MGLPVTLGGFRGHRGQQITAFQPGVKFLLKGVVHNSEKYDNVLSFWKRDEKIDMNIMSVRSVWSWLQAMISLA